MKEIFLDIQFYPHGKTGPVRDFLEELRKVDAKAAAKLAIDIQVISTEGIHSKRVKVAQLDSGLWELKRPYAKVEYRIIFCIHKSNIWLLDSFIKKTRKTPRKILNLARQRLKEVISK